MVFTRKTLDEEVELKSVTWSFRYSLIMVGETISAEGVLIVIHFCLSTRESLKDKGNEFEWVDSQERPISGLFCTVLQLLTLCPYLSL